MYWAVLTADCRNSVCLPNITAAAATSAFN